MVEWVHGSTLTPHGSGPVQVWSIIWIGCTPWHPVHLTATARAHLLVDTSVISQVILQTSGVCLYRFRKARTSSQGSRESSLLHPTRIRV